MKPMNPMTRDELLLAIAQLEQSVGALVVIQTVAAMDRLPSDERERMSLALSGLTKEVLPALGRLVERAIHEMNAPPEAP